MEKTESDGTSGSRRRKISVGRIKERSDDAPAKG
jgi:hypothetical protein